jgi:hypothetical protein
MILRRPCAATLLFRDGHLSADRSLVAVRRPARIETVAKSYPGVSFTAGSALPARPHTAIVNKA